VLLGCRKTAWEDKHCSSSLYGRTVRLHNHLLRLSSAWLRCAQLYLNSYPWTGACDDYIFVAGVCAADYYRLRLLPPRALPTHVLPTAFRHCTALSSVPLFLFAA